MDSLFNMLVSLPVYRRLIDETEVLPGAGQNPARRSMKNANRFPDRGNLPNPAVLDRLFRPAFLRNSGWKVKGTAAVY